MPNMADDQVHENVPDETTDAGADVEMTETTGLAKGAEGGEGGDAAKDANGTEKPTDDTETVEPRISFATYLMSPVVTLFVGAVNGETAVLTAHQALLNQSPYFRDIFDLWGDDSVSFPFHRRATRDFALRATANTYRTVTPGCAHRL